MLATSTTRPTIVPRRGESLTAAVCRVLDPRAGSGLAEVDLQAARLEDRAATAEQLAQLQRDLAEARRSLALRHAAQVAELQEALSDAYARIHCLEHNNALLLRRAGRLAKRVKGLEEDLGHALTALEG